MCFRERYRDLILAADSIAEMKQTSESVIAKIVNIEKTFHDLQQKYLIGFKMETEHINPQRYRIDSLFHITVSVGRVILMYITGLRILSQTLWSCRSRFSWTFQNKFGQR